ncbi:MAG: hypothetical protein WCG27_00790 [Pseudomonadota bacterium]
MEKISLKNFAYIPVNHTSSSPATEIDLVKEKAPPFNDVFQAVIIRNAAGDTIYLPQYFKKKEQNPIPMMYRITSRLDIHQ